ncbi:hypothetical protein SAMD00023353_0800860 [Rosellinia necatrix]|uniref:Uncharacterized protein n=1 Tax=Rosellinia necatrix TaxID=77044 RepID=A0A1S8A726_ROSNE|nr:hypothetical protein SAMD00023353_0800860 [Rosellinia necatrix]
MSRPPRGFFVAGAHGLDSLSKPIRARARNRQSDQDPRQPGNAMPDLFLPPRHLSV